MTVIARLALVLVAQLLWIQTASAKDDFLPPEQAYRYTARVEGDRVIVAWNIGVQDDDLVRQGISRVVQSCSEFAAALRSAIHQSAQIRWLGRVPDINWILCLAVLCERPARRQGRSTRAVIFK